MPAPDSQLMQRALKIWRMLVSILLGYRGEFLALRAGNLTFITVTALVPLAAVIFSLLHFFNAEKIDPLILRFFEDILSPGGKAQSEATIKKFLLAASSRAAGGISFVVVLISSALMLRHLDASMNDIWAVRQKRRLLVSAAMYAGILFLGPLFIGASLVGTDAVKRLVLWLQFPGSQQTFFLGGVITATTLFTLLYKFAPHAPVPWRSALAGGVSAGLCWEAARHLYGGLASLVFSANPLYGSMGIAPLFLMWIYLGWYIVLAGARLAYAVEHKEFHGEFQDLSNHPRSRELLGARIAALVTVGQQNVQPENTRSLAEKMKLPQQRVMDLTQRLYRAGLLQKTAQGAWVPAKSPRDLTLADISLAVGAHLAMRTPDHASAFLAISHIFEELDGAHESKLKTVTWSELAAELQ
jgi:membrane protein